MQQRNELRRSTIISTEVSAPWWQEPLDLVAADLSPRGMYLICDDEMPELGDTLFCSFSLEQNKPDYNFFSTVKRVNWHRRKTDLYRPGFGVEFINPEPWKKLLIRNRLQGLPPPIPSKRRGGYIATVEKRVELPFSNDWCETNRRLLSYEASPRKRPLVQSGIKYYC